MHAYSYLAYPLEVENFPVIRITEWFNKESLGIQYTIRVVYV